MGLEGPLDDGFSWRKYGQKDILGAKHPRYLYLGHIQFSSYETNLYMFLASTSDSVDLCCVAEVITDALIGMFKVVWPQSKCNAPMRTQ